MLNIYYGEMPDAIYNTAVYFKNVYQDDWLTDPFAQRMIKGVDKSKVLDKHLIESKALGLIPPTELSGGVKTLLLIYNLPEKVFNASTCGDNCAKYILMMAKKKDITINLHHIMDFGDGSFEIKILNNGQIVHSMKELVMVAGYFV
jgi:hypothetical protein